MVSYEQIFKYILDMIIRRLNTQSFLRVNIINNVIIWIWVLIASVPCLSILFTFIFTCTSVRERENSMILICIINYYNEKNNAWCETCIFLISVGAILTSIGFLSQRQFSEGHNTVLKLPVLFSSNEVDSWMSY